MTPAVTLAMPVRNGARFMEAALASLLAQTFTDFELLILDNASTDATPEIARRAAASDRRVRYVRNPTNLGAGGNFNRAAELATAPLFKWCAHDDLVSPDYVAACVATLAAHPDAVTAYGRLVGIDAEGRETGHTEELLPPQTGTPAWRRFRALMYRQGLDAAIFGLHRREALLATSLHRPYYGSDCALLAELALLGPFVLAPGATLYNRDHPSRSVNMASADRLAWQAPAGNRANAHEFSSRVAHLLAIAGRHRDAAPLPLTAGAVLVWSAHPVHLGRLSLEAVGAVSPALRHRVRAAALATARRLDRRPRPNG